MSQLEIKIEKNIPIPTISCKFPFDKMQVGDSFIIPDEIPHTRVRVKCIQYVKKNNLSHKFSIKKVNKGYRCWRVK